MTARTRLLLDFAPLAVFFVTYKLWGIMAATAAIMVVTLITLGVIYQHEKKLAVMPLVTGIMVAIFGTLTLVLDDAEFIKMKPTLVNCIFASILIGGVLMKKGLLKYILGTAFSLTDEGWRKLSLRWGFFFLFLAGLNEYIWRNYPESFWVNFKVFGMFTLTIVFTLTQILLIKKYMLTEQSAEGESVTMLFKKLVLFASLIVAVLLTWFVIDTVSDISTMRHAAAAVAQEETTMAKLHEGFAKQCTQDADCLLVPATCNSCNCKYEAIAAAETEKYSKERADICVSSKHTLHAKCDMDCRHQAKCVSGQCSVQPVR